MAWTGDLPGAVTQGRTLEELRESLKDAIGLMLEPVDSQLLPKASSQLIHEVLTL